MKKYMAIALLAVTLGMSGCGNDDDFVFTAAQGTISAPVCAADAYTTNANTALTVPAATGVLANDTPNGATLAFAATSAQGGTVTGGQGGGFTYTPPANFNGTDTFTYTLANSGGAVTCTVTITVVAVNGFFVDAATGSDTTGSFTNGLPFATIQAAVTAAGTNQTIVVRPGTYNGNITLLNGQRLLGSGSSLITPQGTVRPIINAAGISLADGNTVDFLRIQNAPVNSIDGLNHTSGTISNCEIINSGDLGICLEDTQGNWLIQGNLIDGTVDTLGIGLVCVSDGPSLVTYRILNNTITNCDVGALGLGASLTENARFQVEDNTFSNTVVQGATVETTNGTTSTICSRIVNNFNDDAYSLGRAPGATQNVERLSQLATINTGGAVVSTPPGFQAVTEVADGFCGF